MTADIGGELIAAFAIAGLLEILLPLVLAIIAWGRLGAGWRYFAYGALIFFLFQLITRVPAVAVIQTALLPQLQASLTLRIIFGVALALTAGLFEEVGRYVGYRWLMRREEKTWSKAVMYGLGHGGIESILLVGLGVLAQAVLLIQFSTTGLDAIPAEQRELVEQQLATLTAGPAWLPLIGVWERAGAIIFHVALSVVVLQVFRRNDIRWLWLAILAHALLDLFAVLIPTLLSDQLTAILIVEAIVGVAALISLWVIRRLRDQPAEVEEVVAP